MVASIERLFSEATDLDSAQKVSRFFVQRLPTIIQYFPTKRVLAFNFKKNS